MTMDTAILTAASITPAGLIRIAAEALAETGCTCRELPAGSAPCRACREAGYLDKIASRVDMPEAMALIVEACGNSGVDLLSLLPGIIEGVLDHDPNACTCDSDAMCPTCTAAHDLDNVSRQLAA